MFFTIGHSNHSFATFLELLKRHHIGQVADVRSVPYSAYAPQFNSNTLCRELGARGIQYHAFGDTLGARTQNPKCVINGRVSYRLIGRSDAFRAGLSTLLEFGQRGRTAIMCAEQHPLTCHRGLLVSRALVQIAGPDIAPPELNHILPDGSLMAHGTFEDQLLSLTGLGDDDLINALTPRTERLATAYAVRTRDPAPDAQSLPGLTEGSHLDQE
ncbi:MAG: DUF488 domain-containing protein [Pseudomonadota bacterium]